MSRHRVVATGAARCADGLRDRITPHARHASTALRHQLPVEPGRQQRLFRRSDQADWRAVPDRRADLGLSSARSRDLEGLQSARRNVAAARRPDQRVELQELLRLRHLLGYQRRAERQSRHSPTARSPGRRARSSSACPMLGEMDAAPLHPLCRRAGDAQRWLQYADAAGAAARAAGHRLSLPERDERPVSRASSRTWRDARSATSGRPPTPPPASRRTATRARRRAASPPSASR